MAASLRAGRALVVVGSTLVLTGLLAGPASAASTAPSTFDDGEQRGTTMSVGTALLVFVGIPLLVAAVVWLLVQAPSWTRSGRANATDAWTGDPVAVSGGQEQAAAVGAAARPEPVESAPGTDEDAAAEGTGGTSARW